MYLELSYSDRRQNGSFDQFDQNHSMPKNKTAATLLHNGPDASISRRWPQPRPLIAAISARSSRTQKSPLTPAPAVVDTTSPRSPMEPIPEDGTPDLFEDLQNLPATPTPPTDQSMTTLLS